MKKNALRPNDAKVSTQLKLNGRDHVRWSQRGASQQKQGDFAEGNRGDQQRYRGQKSGHWKYRTRILCARTVR